HVGVAPATATITADQTQQFAETAYDANNNPLQGMTFAWSTSDGTVGASGLFTPQKTGTHTITATTQGKSAAGQVTVTPGAAVSVSISPSPVTIAADRTQQFAAAGQDAKGNPVTTFSWVTSGGAVSQTGLYTPDRIGQWQVTVSSGGKNAVAQVFVTPGALAKLEVDPDGVTVRADRTQQYTAKGMDAKGNDVAVTPKWTVVDGDVSTAGLFTPEKVGQWQITATQGGISDAVTVNVVPGAIAGLTMTPASSTLDKGQQVKFELQAEDSKGNEIPLADAEVVWSVVGGSPGSVDQNGVFTGEFPGSATVRATATYLGESKSADSKVTVHWWILYLLLIALGVMSMIGVGAARRRKRKKEAARLAAQSQGEFWPGDQWATGQSTPAAQWPPPGDAR
ncbi:MAG: Ig-like domain-containing protein, partial [Gammaproteobacteria bacterium]